MIKTILGRPIKAILNVLIKGSIVILKLIALVPKTALRLERIQENQIDFDIPADKERWDAMRALRKITPKNKWKAVQTDSLIKAMGWDSSQIKAIEVYPSVGIDGEIPHRKYVGRITFHTAAGKMLWKLANGGAQ